MDDNNINIIKSTITAILPDCTVILFGSRSRGDNEANSDYDLLVNTPQPLKLEEKRGLQAQIRRSLAKYLIAADIIIYNKNEYDNKSVIFNHFAATIKKEGVIL